MSETRPLQRVIFSSKPLDGFIKVDGHFKIYPVHQWLRLNESPIYHQEMPPPRSEAPNVFGPPYPLHIEVDVPYPEKIEWFSNGLRLLDCYEKLACFFIPGIELATHERNQSQWTAIYDSGPNGTTVSYAITQIGFSVDGDGGFNRYLGEGGRAAKPLCGAIDFYDALLVASVVEFPENLDRLLTCYASLPNKLADNFNRAVFLFQQGEFLRTSKFEPLVSYSSAIECLLRREKKSCRSCGQDIFGIGKKFREFMIDFASVSDALVADRKRMYDTRSKAAHGIHVSRVDRNPSQSSFDENNFLFPWLVRKGIVNWLLNTSKQKA